MTGKTLAGIVVAGLLAAFSLAMAQEHATPKAVETPALLLSPKLREALIAEMSGIKEGVAEISVSLAMGEWDAAARRAGQIRDSYIMKKKLSGTELKELEHALPGDFVEMDSQFHRHSEGLAHAALEHNYELAVFYFSRMMEGCGSCHARYASHVFKGFRHTEQIEHTH